MVTHARTKTKAIVPHSVAMEIQDLNKISHLGVSTEDSNHGPLKPFPLVI
jgi:hypothetical protein